jgi:hypothetical protein
LGVAMNWRLFYEMRVPPPATKNCLLRRRWRDPLEVKVQTLKLYNFLHVYPLFMRSFLFLLLSALASCTTVPKETGPLQLSDLNFGDYEREAIVREKVDSIYGIRTRPFRDLEESMTYSENGALLHHFEYYSNHQWFSYTEDGLRDRVVSQMSLDSMDYKLSYRFVADSLVLYEDRKPLKRGYVERAEYLFHPNGFVKERVDRFEIGFRKYVYVYDDQWRLVSVTALEPDEAVASRLQLYYSEGLDSTHYFNLHPLNHNYVRTYYSDRGIRMYQLKWDTFPNMCVRPKFDSVVWRVGRG